MVHWSEVSEGYRVKVSRRPEAYAATCLGIIVCLLAIALAFGATSAKRGPLGAAAVLGMVGVFLLVNGARTSGMRGVLEVAARGGSARWCSGRSSVPGPWTEVSVFVPCRGKARRYSVRALLTNGGDALPFGTWCTDNRREIDKHVARLNELLCARVSGDALPMFLSWPWGFESPCRVEVGSAGPGLSRGFLGALCAFALAGVFWSSAGTLPLWVALCCAAVALAAYVAHRLLKMGTAWVEVTRPGGAVTFSSFVEGTWSMRTHVERFEVETFSPYWPEHTVAAIRPSGERHHAFGTWRTDDLEYAAAVAAELNHLLTRRPLPPSGA